MCMLHALSSFPKTNSEGSSGGAINERAQKTLILALVLLAVAVVVAVVLREMLASHSGCHEARHHCPLHVVAICQCFDEHSDRLGHHPKKESH